MAVIQKQATQSVSIALTIRNRTKADGTSVPYQFEMIYGIIEDIVTFPPFTGEYPTPTPPDTTTLLNAPYIYGPVQILKAGAPLALGVEESWSTSWGLPMEMLRLGGMKENTYYRVRIDVKFPTTGQGRVFFSTDVIVLVKPTVSPEIEITGMVLA